MKRDTQFLFFSFLGAYCIGAFITTATFVIFSISEGALLSTSIVMGFAGIISLQFAIKIDEKSKEEGEL